MKPEGDQNRINRTWQEPVMVQIGKGAISDNIVKETIRLLKKHHYIKIRVLRSAMEGPSKFELINDLCDKTRAVLAGVRGNTAVIYRTPGSPRA